MLVLLKNRELMYYNVNSKEIHHVRKPLNLNFGSTGGKPDGTGPGFQSPKKGNLATGGKNHLDKKHLSFEPDGKKRGKNSYNESSNNLKDKPQKADEENFVTKAINFNMFDNPKGNFITVSTNKSVYMIDIKKKSLESIMTITNTHDDCISSIDFAPNLKHFVSSSLDSKAYIYDSLTRKKICAFDFIGSGGTKFESAEMSCNRFDSFNSGGLPGNSISRSSHKGKFDPRLGGVFRRNSDLKLGLTALENSINNKLSSMCYSKCGIFMGIGMGGGDIKIYRTDSWEIYNEVLGAHDDEVYQLNFCREEFGLKILSVSKFGMKMHEFDIDKEYESRKTYTSSVISEEDSQGDSSLSNASSKIVCKELPGNVSLVTTKEQGPIMSGFGKMVKSIQELPPARNPALKVFAWMNDNSVSSPDSRPHQAGPGPSPKTPTLPSSEHPFSYAISINKIESEKSGNGIANQVDSPLSIVSNKKTPTHDPIAPSKPRAFNSLSDLSKRVSSELSKSYVPLESVNFLEVSNFPSSPTFNHPNTSTGFMHSRSGELRLGPEVVPITPPSLGYGLATNEATSTKQTLYTIPSEKTPAYTIPSEKTPNRTKTPTPKSGYGSEKHVGLSYKTLKLVKKQNSSV